VSKLRDIASSKHIRNLIGFSIVGVVVTIFSMVLLYVFNDVIKMNAYVAYMLAYALSIALSYYLNARKVYKTKSSGRKIVLYFIVYVSSMALGVGLLHMFLLVFPDWNRTLLSYMVIPFTTLYNFIFVSWILKDKK
jgi:putative flippase GtrA